ncbi:hypothetical protein QT381_00955 [Galbitalea sp. SE-J8]|uniref:hypothetical protein n=1 Tax=Galbitalea sp. SE-J8 TaxID=3054952 RepID=UPI00259D0535|nr:hypothetical protein [Galbitalea sp. SE-J8]MDM4761577.1 hypothetical protein [Galbitalea sp. SE-J8]
MTDDGRPLDPRFDPAFQRGYVGEVRTQHRRPTIGTPSVLPAGSLVDGRPSPSPSVATAPVAPTAAALPATLPATLPAPPTVVTTEPDADADADADDAVVSRVRVNPFVIALVALAIGFGLVGVWLVQVALAPVEDTNNASQQAWIMVQLATYGAPIAFGAAGLAIVAAVAVLGIRWRR